MQKSCLYRCSMLIMLTSFLWWSAPATYAQTSDGAPAGDQAPPTVLPIVPDELRTKTLSTTVRVIVQLSLPTEPEGRLRSADAVQTQRAAIRSAQNQLVEETKTSQGVSFLSAFETLPMMVLEVDAAGLDILAARTDITHIVEDEPVLPSLYSSLDVIGGNSVQATGYDGTGGAVAILDTGVDVEHVAFNTGRSRIVAEACFSTSSDTYGGVYSVCPGGASESTVAGSADDCVDEVTALGLTFAATDCKHGTHVAGIIGANDGNETIGVAPDVDLIPVQVFSAFDSYGRMLSFTSDQIKGLEYVLSLADSHNIVAVNMSLGGNHNPVACDFDARRQAILNLQSVGIPTIIASGNEGYGDGVGKPGCISEAITVGATNNNDSVASYSNISNQIDLLAPGSSIRSTYPNNSSGTMSGTSMAAPMVAGAFAILAESHPAVSAQEKLVALQNSGVPVNDERSFGTVTGMKRIQIDGAIALLGGSLSLTFENENSQLFFGGKTETISMVVSNQSNSDLTGLVLTVPIPENFAPDKTALTHGGVVSEGEMVWKSLSVSAVSSTTVSFTGMPVNNQSLNMTAKLVDAGQNTAEATFEAAISPLASCNFHDSFEFDLIDDEWQLAGSGQFRQSVNVAKWGSQSLVLEDGNSDGVAGLTTADIAFMVSDSGTQLINLHWAAYGADFNPATSGLFISTDLGASWRQVSAPQQTGVWENGQVDLLAQAVAAGLQPDDVVLVRLQYSGDGMVDEQNLAVSAGMLIDDFQVNCGGTLVWNGNGESGVWSDPHNWTPNLTPNQNHLLFDDRSQKASILDADFHNPIADLTLAYGWTATLTQVGPLKILGDYYQQSGNVIISGDTPPQVEGSFIFLDGSIKQTRSTTGTELDFMTIWNLDQEIQKYGGYQLDSHVGLSGAGNMTVTMTGPTYGQSTCAAESGDMMASRCFDIQASPVVSVTNRLWLENGEFETGDKAIAEGLSLTSSDEDVPELTVMAYVDGNWEIQNDFTFGTVAGKPFVDIVLSEPVPVLAQQIQSVPTAVKLVSFGAEKDPVMIWDDLVIVAVYIFFLIMTGAVLRLYHQHLKTEGDEPAAVPAD